MMVIAGTDSRNLAQNIAKCLGAQLAHTETKRFPDGEIYVRVFQNLDNEVVVLVNNTYPDQNIIELLLLQDAIKEYNIKKLITVIPYFGYARQDRRFNEGEPVSARVMARIVQQNTDSIILVNLHNESILQWFDIPVYEVKTEHAIAQYVRRFNPSIIISPDKGSIDRAKYVAELLNVSYEYFEKRRISSDKVQIVEKKLPVLDKVVAIVDDMISTGGTIRATAQILRNQHAQKIIVACVHGLFVNNALQKLSMYVDAIISTDTIQTEKSVVTVSGSICDMIIKKNLNK